MADKYCCFLHPKKEYSLKELYDKCPFCGKRYDFPYTERPTTIRDLNIESAAGRGFYGITYKALQGRFNKPKAVKVIPKAIYDLFGKNFSNECDAHEALANNTEHLVKIEDAFDADVRFGELVLPCHVAVLDWVDGTTLHELLMSEQSLEATEVAQIALDLLSLLDELQRGGMRHNDLHNKNIVVERNANAPQRTDRIHTSIKAIAVDFGSIADASLSGDSRIGDLANVGSHICELTKQIRDNPTAESDLNWRLAFALDQTARSLLREPTSQRLSFSDLRTEIYTLAIHRARTPVWRSSLQLTSFAEHYNALTIESAYIPDLLVLPAQSTWSNAVQIPGPQVISGMRGCGKTMLLKSLDFHARAFREQGEAPEDVIEKLTKERFVGLFLSCAKLLDQTNRSSNNLHARLLIGYALSTLRICQHLQDLKPSSVDVRFAQYIAEALKECVEPDSDLFDTTSELKLEEILVRTQLQLGQQDLIRLKSSPGNVFPIFAGLFEKISPSIFNGSHVLFLLDDVSTRFISEETISELISALLFSHEKCSFKFTTEAQTLEIVLKSPGRIEHARQGRDYTVFNLGTEVSRLIRGKGNEGKNFIADILDRRCKVYQRHPNLSALNILGDQPLTDIAKAIGGSFDNPDGRKKIYWGLSAITNLCVGDVGEVIRLYEDIIKHVNPNELPVAAEVQHKCFQHICTSALHDVNRRDTKFKEHALGFASAAHKLLRKSLAAKGSAKTRIRQYAQVYVSISEGNQEWIFNEIRQLIDAGIYTLDSSTIAPRTKRVNANPMQQFILTYRKLYGLSTLIGLSYRDRFELSGIDLETWLSSPDKSEELFLRNEGGDDNQLNDEENRDSEQLRQEKDAFDAEHVISERRSEASIPHLEQKELALWGMNPEDPSSEVNSNSVNAFNLLDVEIEEVDAVHGKHFDLVICALGFEERCEESLRRILGNCNVSKALLIKFPLKGRSDEMIGILSERNVSWSIIDFEALCDLKIADDDRSVLLDISGLAKPAIFHLCQRILTQRRVAWFCYTQAAQYFPSEEEVVPVIQASQAEDVSLLLEGVARIFSGEEKPYEQISLLKEQQDDSRPRALLAFASAKHERLMSLIDERFFDYVGIAYSPSQTGRGRISEIAAKFALRNVNRAGCYPVDPSNLQENIQVLSQLYYELYYNGGYNVEIGLTGSKISGLAAAILATRWKISQAWYVKPEHFNSERFTQGVGSSKFFQVTLK